MPLWYGGSFTTIGTYSVENDEIHFLHDTPCDEDNSDSATYTLTYEDRRLSFELIGEDLCDGRRDTTSWSWSGPQ